MTADTCGYKTQNTAGDAVNATVTVVNKLKRNYLVDKAWLGLAQPRSA